MQQIELVGELGVWSERGRASVWLHASDSYVSSVVQGPSRRKGKPSYEGERDEGGGFLELREGRSGGRVIRYFVCCFEKSTCSKA